MMSSKILRSFVRPASGVASVARSSALARAASTLAPSKASLSVTSSRASVHASVPSAFSSTTSWKINVPSPVPPPGDLPALRVKAAKETDRLAEVVQAKKFSAWLASQPAAAVDPAAAARVAESGLSQDDLKIALKAAMMTFLLHVESRVSSALGQGYYTIGPCGEELMGALALAVRDNDALALHYRHLAVQIVRQLRAGRSDADILRDRARAHTVAASDPVTGGAHCALGGGERDFLVTSTLASQACPAVGRAMGAGLGHFVAAQTEGFTPLLDKDAVSLVSLGDGSINNGHFLSAVNLAEYAAFRKFRCPTVFVVTDNGLSISLRGYGYLSKQWLKRLQMPLYQAQGTDFLSIYKATADAAAYSRSRASPSFVYIGGIQRRFGHAATDRQAAYMPAEEIGALADSNVVEGLSTLLATAGVMPYSEQAAMFEQVWAAARTAFDGAAAEPKIDSRADMIDRVSVPLTPLPPAAHAAVGEEGSAGTVAGTVGSLTPPGALPASGVAISADRTKWLNPQTRAAETLHAPRFDAAAAAVGATAGKDVMRKHMTRVYDELMSAYPHMAYLGEDVVHGGYYLVSEGLASKYPHRVRDFPPDETSLVGAGMGFAQTGLLPIVEIPYAKYLDCGADMFYEAALSSWLSNQKQPNGMIVRLQGFGKGVFGGNFHTHNTLYLPPGIDTVCYSNGADYAMGIRYAALQASRGRVVMSVDATHLLNLRHVNDGDDAWRKNYTDPTAMMDFDQVRTYAPPADGPAAAAEGGKRVAVVTYGEGVVTALQTRAKLHEHGILAAEGFDVVVIDCPLLSRVPEGLRTALAQGGFHGVVFADPCKEGQAPLQGHVTKLQQEGGLGDKWQFVGAQPTYNPLGSTLTFLSPEDITTAVSKLF